MPTNHKQQTTDPLIEHFSSFIIRVGEDVDMNFKSAEGTKLITLMAVLLLAIGMGYMDSHAKDAALAKATFYVY